MNVIVNLLIGNIIFLQFLLTSQQLLLAILTAWSSYKKNDEFVGLVERKYLFIWFDFYADLPEKYVQSSA